MPPGRRACWPPAATGWLRPCWTGHWNSWPTGLCSAGRPAEAIPLFEQTLVGRQRLLGADHPRTLGTRNNLAAAYRDVGRVDEAILLFEQALAGRERILGIDHPDTVTTRNNLALVYKDADRAS